MKEFSRGERSGNGFGNAAGNGAWRDVDMTDTASPITRLTSHLEARSRTQEGREAMARFARAGIRLEGERTPLELAEACHGPSPSGSANAVVCGLARIAGSDELAGLTALVALRPVLLKLAQSQRRGGANREEAEAEVLYAAWETIIERGGQAGREDSVTRILSGIWAKSRTRLRRRWRAERLETPRANIPDQGANGAEPESCVSTLLGEALRSGALSRDQAVLLAETRGRDMSVRDVAALNGFTAASVRSRRRRAERALRDYVADSDQEHPDE